MVVERGFRPREMRSLWEWHGGQAVVRRPLPMLPLEQGQSQFYKRCHTMLRAYLLVSSVDMEISPPPPSLADVSRSPMILTTAFRVLEDLTLFLKFLT